MERRIKINYCDKGKQDATFCYECGTAIHWNNIQGFQRYLEVCEEKAKEKLKEIKASPEKDRNVPHSIAVKRAAHKLEKWQIWRKWVEAKRKIDTDKDVDTSRNKQRT